MTGQNYTYPDKLGFGETLMFHLRAMSMELASDGLDEEFEDMIDLLMWILNPYIEEDGKAQNVKDANDHGATFARTDIINWGPAKRERCRLKMEIAMGTMHKHGLLLKRVPDFENEFDPNELPVEG